MEKKVYFSNSKGDKLCSILSNPTSKNDIPIMILCHGFTTSKDNSTNTKLQKILNKRKIATFRFDLYGHGESDGKFENITVSEAVDDILNAIKYLKKKKYSKIGLFGNSFSGISSVMASATTNDLFVLILKSPVSDYSEQYKSKMSKKDINNWKKIGFIIHTNSKGIQKKLNYSFFEDIKNNNAYAAAKKIKIPTLIIHGDKDVDVPIAQSKKIAKLIRNCKLEIIKGADHYYPKRTDYKKMLSLTYKFVIKNIPF